MKGSSVVFILLFIAAPSYADAIQIITDQSDFIAAIETPYLFDNFSEFTYGAYRQYSLRLDENGYEALISANSGLYSLQESISTRCDYDILRISFIGSAFPVTAIGGSFWPTDMPGTDLTGQTRVVLSNGTEYVIENAGHSDFLGFLNVDGTSFQSLEISVLSRHTWPTLDNLYVGSARDMSEDDTSSILTPEPATIFLVASGILGIGIAVRRRRF
jgi:hypothetical protein